MNPPNPERVAELVATDAARFEHIASQLRLVFCALGLLTIGGNWGSNSTTNLAIVSVSTAVLSGWAVFILFRTRAAAAAAWTK